MAQAVGGDAQPSDDNGGLPEMAAHQVALALPAVFEASFGNKLDPADIIASLEQELDETYRSVTQLTNELEQTRIRLEKLSLYDDLTGLANRTLFYDRLEQGCEVAKREGKMLPVLMMDLVRFKEINDTLGHGAGDNVLREVAQRLEKTLRQSDTVARIGGDEFVALLPSVSEIDDVITVVQKIVHAIEKPIRLGDESVDIGISIGIAVYPEHGADSAIVLSNSDSAMYSAKHDGSSYVIYGSNGMKDHLQRIALANRLRTGIADHELFLEYQPKYRLKTGQMTGVEALVRWRHPEFGRVAPNDFIPAAERTGVIKPLTLEVLDQAIAQAVVWHRQNIALDLAVNVSARVLNDWELPDQVIGLLKRKSLPPELLTIEITETALMKNPDQAMKVLEQIKRMGITISIDDFGTGYTSLVHLKKMPVDELKIDMTFIQNLVENKDDLAIVQSIIDLSRNLEIKVVAEGVENAETIDILRRLRCDFAQGYYLARPMSADDLILAFNETPGNWNSAERRSA